MNVRVLISIITVFIATLTNFYGQTQTLEINVECIDQVIGNTRCVKFSTNAVDEVESIQFTISYDPNVLKFVDPPVVSNSCLTNLVVDNLVTTTPGQLAFVWADSPKNLTQGCELFTLCFEYIGEPGSTSPITITSLAAEIEATSAIGPVNVVINDCIVEVLPNGRATVAKFCNPTSVNSQDGKICFYGIGGVGPYTYTLKDKNGDIVASGTIADKEEICIDNLSSQQYTISINDQGNIPFPPRTINLIDIGANPKFDLDVKYPSCFNRADGQLTLQNIFVSTIGKSIKWSNGAYNVEQQQYLKNGNYTVSVTDQNGCTTTKSIALFADTLKLTTAIIDPATCLGLNDGFVRLTGSGGTPFPDGTYSFAINNTAFFKASANPFVSVSTPGGKIIIRMRDDAKNFLGNSAPCEIETMIDVPYKEKLLVDEFTIEDILCKGKDLGKVRFKLSGTGTGYSLIVQRKEGTSTTINPTFTAEGSTGAFFNNELMVGKYFVIARSSKGCRDTIRFEIKEPTNPFTITADITQPSCSGPGKIKINTVGGVAPIKITWEDGQMVNEKTGLLPGTYKITVTDDIKCDSIFNIELKSSDNGKIEADILKAITCKDAKNGEVIANSPTGTVFTYEWKNKQGQVLGNNKILTGLSSGTYYLVATVDGCPAIDSVFLANPEGISIVAVNLTKPECLIGGLRGSIGLTVEGGAGPYNFEWKKQGNNTILGTLSLLPNLLAGTYTVQIKDQAACTKDTIITLLPPDPFIIDVTNLIGVSCFGYSDGKANAKASGGTVQNGKYTFFWSNNQKSNGVFDRDINLTLSGGKNWVFVTDSKCVSDTVFFDIVSPPAIIANYTATGICGGDCKGQIDVIATGGSAPPLVVSWPTIPNQTGNTVFNLCVGEYPFEVKDGNGCILMDTAIVDAGDSIKIKLNESQSELISCRKSIGQLVIDVQGGNAPYKYNWIGSTSTTNVAKDLSDGTYSVTVTDVNGCTSSFSYTLSRPNPISAVLTEPQVPKCSGGTSCITVLSVTGGTGNYTMQINNGFRIPIDSCQQLFPGNYLFSIYDGSGCKTDYPIVIPSGSEFNINLGEDINLTLGDSINELRPIINASTVIVNYTWSGQGNLACIGLDCEALTGAPLADYLVKLIVTDENGCTAVDEVQISVKDIRNVYLPNIFKQSSSDEKNKRFDIVIGDGVEEVEEFTIYDRWGDIVHTRKNYKPDLTTGWDGLLGGQQALPGVYVFRAKVKFVDGIEKVYHGDVMLLK